MSSVPGKPAARQVLATYGCMLLWITLSAGVILLNKYILSYAGFPYPIALTSLHMGFCSALAWLLVKLGYCDAVHLSFETYFRCIVPIGLLFAGTLWLGNAAYLSLSVSFIQMLKASTPIVVFLVGVCFQTEAFTLKLASNMVVVVTGVLIATYGEVQFVLVGVALQVASIFTEATRLTLVQILLQSRGIKLNPVSTLYHVAPCCFAFLLGPLLALEVPRMLHSPDFVVNYPLLLSSAASAFGLNMAIFLLIGRTSALTMNVAGVVKDWLLILLSVVVFGSTVTWTQIGGYALAFSGVMYYNYEKIHASRPAPAAGPARDSSETTRPLLVPEGPHEKVDPAKVVSPMNNTSTWTIRAPKDLRAPKDNSNAGAQRV